MIAQQRYKVRVLTQPSTPTSTTSAPTVAMVSTQTPVTSSTAVMSVPITVYNLATGKFKQTPCPPTITQNSNNPPLEDIPSAPIRQGTPWPNAGSVKENLFETRKDWPIPPTPTATIKTEEQPKIAAIPHAMVFPKQATEKCSWGQHCPICASDEEHGEEDWDGTKQNLPRMQPYNVQCPQQLNIQHSESQNIQQPPSFQCPGPQNNQ